METPLKRLPIDDPGYSVELRKALNYSIVDVIDEFTAAGWDKWETRKALTKVVCDHALAYQEDRKSIPHINKAENNWLRPVTVTCGDRGAATRTGCPMTQYVWTLRVRGRQDFQRVTTLEEMQDTLMKLELPGGVPPAWILTNTGLAMTPATDITPCWRHGRMVADLDEAGFVGEESRARCNPGLQCFSSHSTISITARVFGLMSTRLSLTIT